MIDFETLELPKDETLTAKALALAEEALAIQQQLDDYEEDVKSLKGRLRQILDNELPDIMRQDARDHLVLPDGNKFELQRFVQASCPKDDAQRKAFFAWLKSIDALDLVKTDISIPFAKSQNNMALDLAGRLRDEGFPVNVKEDVHHSTLSSFIAKRLDEQQEIPPEDVLSVFQGNKIKIKKATK